VAAFRGCSAVSGEHVPVEASGRTGWSDLCEDGKLEQQGRNGRAFTQGTGDRRSHTRPHMILVIIHTTRRSQTRPYMILVNIYKAQVLRGLRHVLI